jgi:hypothetical protein
MHQYQGIAFVKCCRIPILVHLLKLTLFNALIRSHCIDVQSSGALIDGGATGGLGGSDVRVMWETYCTSNVTGIGAKSLANLPICTVGAVIQTQKGPIIGVFNQYAHCGKG